MWNFDGKVENIGYNGDDNKELLSFSDTKWEIVEKVEAYDEKGKGI